MERILLYLKILFLVFIPNSVSESGCEFKKSSKNEDILRVTCSSQYSVNSNPSSFLDGYRSVHIECKDGEPVDWALYRGVLFGRNGSLESIAFENCENMENLLTEGYLRQSFNLEIAGARLRHFPGKHLHCSLNYLDLRDNDIRNLNLDPFCSKNSLKELNLARNVLKVLHNEVFLGWYSLSKLNLSGNRINSIEENALQPLQGLTSLDLSQNLISVLSPSTFIHLKRLATINLSKNRLVGISPETFPSSLVILNLSENKLRSDLRLLYLDLSFNRLSRISLRRLHQLQKVRLEGNVLERLDPEMFDMNMTELHVLDLTSNEIESIHPNAFINCPALEDVSLKKNKLTYFPSDAISKILSLKVLNIGRNRIIKLSNGTFPVQMKYLHSLILDENAIIEEVGSDVFMRLPNLKTLHLSKNRIQKLYRNLFINNKDMEVVKLDSNRLDDIVGLFKGLPKLNWLNISNNAIDKFDWFLVPNSLHWLDLKHNAIEEIGNYFSLEKEFSLLKSLDVSHNKLTFIGPKILPKNLQFLILRNNFISEIQMHTFIDMKELERVDLFTNQIKHLSKQSLQLSQDLRKRTEFYLGENPFVCDCDLEWLIRINNEDDHLKNNSISCLSERSESNQVIPLIQSTDFLCIYKTHCYSLCLCCDYDACDCEMTCPDHCRCYHDGSWSINIVDCHSAGLDQPPTAIPMDATEVYLQGNDFKKLTSHSFIGRKNLKILFLNSSNIEVILNNTFSGLRRLKILHLENNRITNLTGNEFQSLINLKALYLEGNRISHIHSKTFSYLKELEILRLHDNKLITFHFDIILNGLRSLKVLSLSRNKWNCSDCSWIEASRPWRNLIIDSFSCFDGNYSNAITCPLEDSGLGSSLDLSENRKKIFFESYLPVFIVAGSFLIVLLVFFGVIFYYRQEIRILAFDWSGLRSNGAYDVESKEYDVYVGYSAADDQWVRQILAVHLEEEEHYKLILHHRDFHPNPQLADTILSGSENASSLIFVISKHFISFEWSRFEVRSAMHSVLRRRNSPNRTKARKAIFLLLGDVSTKELDPDLRSYLKNNSTIKRTDKLFWSRLRYRLPEPSSQIAPGTLNLHDTFYTIPFPNEASTLSNHTLLRSNNDDDILYHQHNGYEQNHYFTLSSRLSNGQRVYDENNLQITPKFLDRTYK
ncbi:unnamed protein product [Lepeophtheirus salmonis]|uniref:(salmon louse) hypothetical protein n=1 Tax=Lepeophtheirus salmonis TaxID=72036 RepID=A0A7R8CTZ6_LEPSM|nr:unnamed protein product [Lepeophtheirus salmonis]CAF2930746.1 unnamed protein product [Lepeophtheirus salmonis]